MLWPVRLVFDLYREAAGVVADRVFGEDDLLDYPERSTTSRKRCPSCGQDIPPPYDAGWPNFPA